MPCRPSTDAPRPSHSTFAIPQADARNEGPASATSASLWLCPWRTPPAPAPSAWVGPASAAPHARFGCWGRVGRCWRRRQDHKVMGRDCSVPSTEHARQQHRIWKRGGRFGRSENGIHSGGWGRGGERGRWAGGGGGGGGGAGATEQAKGTASAIKDELESKSAYMKQVGRLGPVPASPAASVKYMSSSMNGIHHH